MIPLTYSALRESDGWIEYEGFALGGIVAAIGASICCVGPLLLLALGIGGAWISNLTALEPYRPIFIGVTLLFLGLTYRQLYFVPQPCAAGAECPDLGALRRQRLIFWLVAVLLLGLLAVPWVAPLFY